MDIGRSSIPDQERTVAGGVSGHRASSDGSAVSANVKRVIALGVTQFAAFSAVLVVGWGGGPGHPGPPAPTPTVTVTKTKIEAPAKHYSRSGTNVPPTPDVASGQGSS